MYNIVVYLNLIKFLISKFKEFMLYVLEFFRYLIFFVLVRWGVEYEQNVLVDYLVFQNVVISLRVEEFGLIIYLFYVFLGVISDGWVYDEFMLEGNQKGVLEIKCLYFIFNDVIIYRGIFFYNSKCKCVYNYFFCFYELINLIYEQYIYLFFNRFMSWQGGKVFVLRSQRMV